MEPRAAPPPLSYGRQPTWVQRRVAAVLVIAFGVGAAGLAERHAHWLRRAWLRVEQLYWQRRIANLSESGGHVAFDRVQAMPMAVVVDAFAGPMTVFHGDCGGVPAVPWNRLESVSPTASRMFSFPGWGGLPSPVLFVGRLRSAAGDRLACVRLESETDGSAGDVQLLLDVTIVTPATLSRPPQAVQSDEALSSNTALGQTPPAGANWTWSDTDIKWVDRGVMDPNDASRFTCEYCTQSGRRHGVEGTLSADGSTVTFAYRVEPNTSAARPAIATPAVGR